MELSEEILALELGLLPRSLICILSRLGVGGLPPYDNLLTGCIVAAVKSDVSPFSLSEGVRTLALLPAVRFL